MKGGAGGLEFVEVRNHPVRAELGHRDVGIAEIDCDHRQARSAGGLDVGNRVADHDRPVAHPAGGRDRAEQGLRIGLADAERVLAADEREPFRHAQLLHQELRRAFHLVGADGLTPAGSRKRCQRRVDAGIEPRALADVAIVMSEKVAEQRLELQGRKLPAGRSEAARDEGAAARAKHRAGVFDRQRRKAFVCQDGVQRAHQVARGVGERAVEVVNDRGSGH